MVDGDNAAKVNICVDFDDTISVRAFGTVFPAEGVIEALQRLYSTDEQQHRFIT